MVSTKRVNSAPTGTLVPTVDASNGQSNVHAFSPSFPKPSKEKKIVNKKCIETERRPAPKTPKIILPGDGNFY